MQYARDFTDALQFMWGEGFLSPGGPEEVAQMVAGHDIAGKRVLDIGSGLGGVDAQLIEAANVLIAKKNLSARIAFKLVEPGPLPFEDGSFDVVFSKDAMVHIDDKPSLFGEVLRV